DPEEYRITDRGGKGVRNIKVTDKNGAAVCIESVREGQEILVITKEGNIIRMQAADTSAIGRDTQGVRVIRLNDTDLVTDVAVVEGEDVDPAQLESEESQRATGKFPILDRNMPPPPGALPADSSGADGEN